MQGLTSCFSPSVILVFSKFSLSSSLLLLLFLITSGFSFCVVFFSSPLLLLQYSPSSSFCLFSALWFEGLGCLFLLAVFLSSCILFSLSNFIFLIFSISSSSFSFSLSPSFSHFLYSLSPILEDSLGIAQRLYSAREFRRLWSCLSCCIFTDSSICLSKAARVYFTTLIPNCTFSTSSSSCLSSMCFRR